MAVGAGIYIGAYAIIDHVDTTSLSHRYVPWAAGGVLLGVITLFCLGCIVVEQGILGIPFPASP